MIEYPPCKICGADHGMGIKNMETGEIEPIDVCRDCLFVGTYFPIIDQITLKELDDTLLPG